MKIFNLLLLLTVFFLLNACQGRSMPMHKDMQSKKKPVKMKQKKKPTLHIEVTDKPKVKKEKRKPLLDMKIEDKPKKHKSKAKKIKVPLVKEKKREKYFPTPTTKKETSERLPSLPTLPSIEREVPVTHKKNKISTLKESDKIINTIPLPTESFSGGGLVDNLDMGAIRIGRSPDYTSIIFDSYTYEGKDKVSSTQSYSSGTYLFTYEPSKNRIIAFIDGYNDFSALKEDQRALFKESKVVKNIYVLKHLGKDGIKFVIKLRKKVRVNIFDVKKPGRIIVNLFPK